MTILECKQMVNKMIKDDAKGNADLIKFYTRKIKEETAKALPAAMNKAFSKE